MSVQLHHTRTGKVLDPGMLALVVGVPLGVALYGGDDPVDPEVTEALATVEVQAAWFCDELDDLVLGRSEESFPVSRDEALDSLAAVAGDGLDGEQMDAVRTAIEERCG